MAVLDRRTNLKLWLEADVLVSNADGDAIQTWPDISGNANDFTQATLANRPLLKTDILNGRPALLFDGSNDLFTGPLLSTFITAVNGGTIYVLAKPTAITANSATPALNDGIFGGSASNTMGMTLRNNASVYTYYTWAYDGTSQKNAARTFAGPNGWYVFVHSYLSTLRNILDDPYNPVSTAMAAGLANTASVAKIGENWNASARFTGYIAAILAVNVEDAAADDKQHTIAYIANKYFSPLIASNVCTIIRGDPVEQGRDVASRRLWAYSAVRPKARVIAPLTAADAELVDLVALSHPDWPHPTGGGAGNQDWARALVRVVGSTIDLDTLTVELDLADMRKGVSYRESGRAVKQFSATRQGDAVVSAGAIRTFQRKSLAWIPDAGDGRIVQISPDMEAITADGLLLEDTDKNRLLRSSFVSGTTGLTLSVGSGTIAVDAVAPLLFDTSVSPNGLRLTAGNPHVTETRVTWPATTTFVAAPAWGTRFWIDHVDRDGTALVYRIQRDFDLKWWRDSDQTWQVAQTDNTLPITASTTIPERHHSQVIGGVTFDAILTLSVVLTSGGTVSRRNTVYHVQLAHTAFFGYESSRIVTNAVADVTRAASRLTIRNVGATSLHGTLLFKLTPLWLQGEVAGTSTGYLLAIGTGATGAGSRYLSFVGDLTNGGLLKHHPAAGTAAQVSFSGHAEGATYRVAMRWTGTGGELGLPQYTSSIFLNGVKGTDSTSALVDIETGDVFSIPPTDLTAVFAIFEQIELRPVAMTDAEIAAWGV